MAQNEAVQRARVRMSVDLLVDPGTASPRVMAALAGEMKEYAEVVLAKDREITLVAFDENEVVDVHTHVSTGEAGACRTCIERLAMDGRQ